MSIFSEIKWTVSKCLFIFFLLFTVSESYADSGIWASGSFGVSNCYGFAGTRRLSGGFQINRFVGQIYTSKTRESIFLKMFVSEKPIEKHYNHGLLGGVSILKNEWIHLFCTSGLSYIHGIERGKLINVENTEFLSEIRTYKSEYFNVLNIPIEFSFSFIKLDYFGVGITLHANLNKEFQDLEVTLNLYTGKLKREREREIDYLR